MVECEYSMDVDFVRLVSVALTLPIFTLALCIQFKALHYLSFSYQMRILLSLLSLDLCFAVVPEIFGKGLDYDPTLAVFFSFALGLFAWSQVLFLERSRIKILRKTVFVSLVRWASVFIAICISLLALGFIVVAVIRSDLPVTLFLAGAFLFWSFAQGMTNIHIQFSKAPVTTNGI